MSARVRWIALGVGLAVLALSVVLALNVGSSEPTVGKSVINKSIDFDVTGLDGEEISAANQAGKTVVVNFWNTWCAPCREELPALTSFANAHRDDADFELVGIVREDTKRAVEGYGPGKEIDWTVGMDPGARASLAFGTRGQPETFAITPEGLIAGAQIGPTTRDDLETLLAAARGRRA